MDYVELFESIMTKPLYLYMPEFAAVTLFGRPTYDKLVKEKATTPPPPESPR